MATAVRLAASPATTAAETFGSYTATPAVGRARLDAVDIVRGLVMVIMLLDHTRDFFHQDALLYNPVDLTRTNPALFFTRWITHYCAPTFVFLAGTAAYLQTLRGKSTRELSKFLIARGFWLIILEFTVVRGLVLFNLDYRFLGIMQVIWAIGVSMIALAALIHLPLRWIAVVGLAMISLHNLLDAVQVASWQGPGSSVPGTVAKLWMILHQGGMFPVAGPSSPIVLAMYPLIPWIGVMAAGYAFGAVYRMDAERRQRLLLRLGVVMIAAFIILRAMNFAGNPYGFASQHGYGDPSAWTMQHSALFTVMSFLNTDKYPPSLLYLLMTLGPAVLALRWLERTDRGHGVVRGALLTFGRVPLFYYLLQWAAAHGLAVLLGLLVGQPVAWQFVNPWEKPGDPIVNSVETSLGGQSLGLGFELWVVYVFWAVGLILLYPLCRWFASVKQRRRDWWLSYA